MRKLSCLALAAVLLSSAALSSCTTTSDAAIQKDLPKICSALETAHTAFAAAVLVTDKIPTRTVVREDAAYQGVRTLCADPAHTTTVNAIFLAAQAYAVITASLKEAKAAG